MTEIASQLSTIFLALFQLRDFFDRGFFEHLIAATGYPVGKLRHEVRIGSKVASVPRPSESCPPSASNQSQPKPNS